MSELKKLLESWNQVKELDIYREGLIGENMMIYIFTEHSEIKNLWKFAVNLKTEKELRDSFETKNHGTFIMRAVDAVMLRLEDKKLEDAEKILFDLGRRHIEYGAKIEHIPILCKALLETIKNALGEDFTREVDQAWQFALNIIGSNVKKGLNS